VQIACLQIGNVNGKRKETKDLDVEKKKLMEKLNTYALFIIHIQLVKIFFFFGQLIIVINQKPFSF